VLQLVEEEYSQYVQPGDLVLAVDGRPTRRGERIFTPPVKTSYEFTLQRGEEIFTQEISVAESPLFQVWQISIGILALAIWFIGFVTMQFAQSGQAPPLYVGLGFQLIAAGIVSPGPTQLGAPGAWIVGHVLIFYFPFIMLYLGFVPRYTPLATSAKKLLRGSFHFLTGLAAIATIETLFLFPERSFKDVVGISLETILVVLAGMGIMIALAILLTRLLRSTKQSYERQQLTILFTFLALAVLPLFIFIIWPIDDALFVPYPFVYSLFLFAPGGYFFVLHRQGYLALAPLFSRIVTVIVLILAVGMAYTTAMYLLNTVFQISFNNAGQGAFIFVFFGIAITGQKQVQAFVDLLLYGRNLLEQDAIQDAKARLSASPEPTTVAYVTSQVAACLNVQRVAVLVKDIEQYKLLTGNMPSFIVPDSTSYQETLLQVKDIDKLALMPRWVELSVPIKARGDMMGLFLLSRPVDGYFNARQVQTLKDIADILAFSLLVISLVGTMQELSQQALLEKELQRRQIATEIHNEPLHTLTTLMMQLQTKAADETFRNAAQTIRQVTRDLRRIISDLRPPVLKESIEWITRQVVREFDETHDAISVMLRTDIQCDEQASEQTKSAFYYILTESLNNISKHSKATKVEIILCYSEENLTLEVRDNGVGVNVTERSLSELLREQHIGLADMYRWTSICGGKLEIKSNISSGTIVEFILSA
jgi:signal transduction histidine kinase